MSDIDKLAQGFFISLVVCSLISDSYITIEKFLKNNYVKKKLNFLNKIYKVVIGITSNNYKNDEEGNIIIDNKKLINNKKSKNPFDDELDDELDDEDDCNDPGGAAMIGCAELKEG
jgi:hypothetical protein